MAEKLLANRLSVQRLGFAAGTLFAFLYAGMLVVVSG
jgi:hypothetical protein